MIVAYSKISYVGEHRKAIKVDDLVVDGYAFGTRILDIETNMFAKVILEQAEQENIHIEDDDVHAYAYNIGLISDQTTMIEEQFVSVMESYIASAVRIKGYDDVATCISYMFSSNPRFKKDAEIYIAWRDKAYDIVHKYVNISRDDPTKPLPTVDDVIKEIGPIDWEDIEQ